jgi:hypothetical protein
VTNSAGFKARHTFRLNPTTGRCWMCGERRGNRREHTGSRCSMCFRYYPIYELDSSRRCDDCRP